MRVNHASWKMNEGARAGRECLASQRELERAFEDVEALVVVAVDVRRRTQLGSGCEFCARKRPVYVVADDSECVQIGQEPEDFPSPLAR